MVTYYRKNTLKSEVAYMCDAILCANNPVLHVLAELDKVIFRQVMSANRTATGN